MEATRESQSAPHRPPVDPPTLVRLLVIGVVAAGIGILIGLEIPWFPPAAAKQAHTIDTLYYVLIVATVPIFVLVTTVVLFSVWRFRMRPGEERLDGPPIHGNTQLEVIWTALPSALIAALVVYAAIVLHDIGVKQPGEETIGVTGQQFEWSFSYPGYKDGQGQTIVTPDLYMQLGKPVVFEIHAVDVIHTFWVPVFRIQEDAVPGITTTFRASPDRIGSYPIICNQLCGWGHSTMRTTLKIISATAFQNFLATHGYSGSSTQTASLQRAAAGALDRAYGSPYAPPTRAQTTTKEGSQ